MKKTFALVAGVALALSASSACATIYGDASGDTFPGVAGGGILDILSVEVTDNGTDINFKVTVGADTNATDWGKYMVMIDTVVGGDNVSNGWGRPIGWGEAPGTGADYWLGSWVEGGNGAQNWAWNGSGWTLQDVTTSPIPNPNISITKNSPSSTITLPLSRLGLSANQNFCFDVFSSGGGGGDGAIDSLGNPTQQVAGWGDYSTAHPVCYTTTPEPGSLALLGLGAAALLRRKH